MCKSLQIAYFGPIGIARVGITRIGFVGIEIIIESIIDVSIEVIIKVIIIEVITEVVTEIFIIGIIVIVVAVEGVKIVRRIWIRGIDVKIPIVDIVVIGIVGIGVIVIIVCKIVIIFVCKVVGFVWYIRDALVFIGIVRKIEFAARAPRRNILREILDRVVQHRGTVRLGRDEDR